MDGSQGPSEVVVWSLGGGRAGRFPFVGASPFAASRIGCGGGGGMERFLEAGLSG